ncbi:MAG: ABC transporter permease [Gemmatimonadota bacterium]|nr:MAG: ABC transporter permease [Gemmatimonadota bacterium]
MTARDGGWTGRVRAGVARVIGLFGQRRRDRDLDDEVQFHLDMLEVQYMSEGMSPDDARAAARRNFGAVAPIKESYRRRRGVPVIESTMRDLRYGVRSLRKAPVFTVTALLSLALGIGANSAIFSVVNSVLLRPLPFPEPDRLVQITRMFPADEAQSLDATRILAVADNVTSFDAIAATGPVTGFNFVTGDGAEYVRALSVTEEYFDVLGVSPRTGRAFLAEEAVPNGPDVVIVSHALWRRLLNSDAAAVGRSVTLSDVPYTIVGVMPEDFRPIPTVDLLVPFGLSQNQAGSFNFRAIARLASGVEISRARDEVAAIAAGLRAAQPDALGDDESLAVRPYAQVVAQDVRPALLVLAGAVGVVLLIACANTANLLLARAVTRGREMAIRTALGAGPRRLVGQLLTESLLLAFVAGTLGLIIAWWTAPALLALSPAAAGWRAVQLDSTVVAATLAIAVLTGLLFGLAPALTLYRAQLSKQLRDDGARTTQNARANWLRRGLVTIEVALSVVLLVAAGLLLQTFNNLRSVDLGFDPENVLTAQMSMNAARYRDPEVAADLFRRGLDRIEQISDVEAVAVVSGLPVERGLNVSITIPDGTETVDRALTDLRYVTPGYFSLMRIPVVMGRAFEQRDGAASPPVALVNREFVRRFVPGGQPLGRHLQIFSRGTVYEIVGVVDNVQEKGLGGDAVPVFYLPAEQVEGNILATAHYFFQTSWVVRTRSNPAGLAERIRREMRAIDPQQPFSSFRPMGAVISESLAAPRFHMVLLSLFSGLALVLAIAGIYGVMTYAVTARIREIGIRMAIGASATRIIRNVLAQGLVLAGVGVVLGVAGAVGITRLLDAFVFGVSTTDLFTFVVVAGGLLVVAGLASSIPALRAARVDPVRTLRTE